MKKIAYIILSLSVLTGLLFNTSPVMATSSHEPLEIVNTGYTIQQIGEEYELYYGIEVKNPNDNYWVYDARYRVTAEDSDGNVIESDDYRISAVYNNQTVGFGYYLSGLSEYPSKVEFELIESTGSWNIGKHVDLELSLENVKMSSDDSYMGGKITGKINNPLNYTYDDLQVYVLFKDKEGKITGGFPGSIEGVKANGKTAYTNSFLPQCIMTDNYYFTFMPVRINNDPTISTTSSSAVEDTTNQETATTTEAQESNTDVESKESHFNPIFIGMIIIVILIVGFAILKTRSKSNKNEVVEQEKKPKEKSELEETIDKCRELVLSIGVYKDKIMNESLQNRIVNICNITTNILDEVSENPEKLTDIRKFSVYYLPTVEKMVKLYSKLEKAQETEQINATMNKIVRFLESADSAFNAIYISMLEDDAMNVSAEISVLENLMAQESNKGKDFHL